jgi:hypothetical protein
MPRFGSVCEESVWRVPKLTSFSTVARMRCAFTWLAYCVTICSGRGGGGIAFEAVASGTRAAIRTSLRILLSHASQLAFGGPEV